ncbi:RNA polymerase sigma factor [Flavobacterium sp. J27]|uniref:RNA polymerase sigma factor n=1 Tax=Flavobacterium sp. J27 TaxID=2060419 RepID=UPI0010316EC6|nr:RNA polymerase sigma factor [Flavobacterium sp. J27]
MSDRNRLDIILINKSIGGDTLAFRDLIEFHKNVSLTLACSILKDQNVAEDAVQMAFISVYHKLHTFKQKSKFSTWLYRIVVNTSYNMLKQQKKHIEIDTDEVLNLEFTKQNEEDILKVTDQKKYIMIALNAIKTDEALVLRLFYLYEYKIPEIQDITGFSKSKIKVNLHRGRINFENHLQKILGKEIKSIL